jgi:hypothetical protein
MPQYVEPQPKPRYNPTFSAHPLEKSNTLSFIFSKADPGSVFRAQNISIGV